MHNITVTKTIGNETTETVVPYEFDTQEEAIEFLEYFMSDEMSSLYDELKKLGDRTTVMAIPAPHRSMRRVCEGTSRKFGRSPIEGRVEVTVNRIA